MKYVAIDNVENCVEYHETLEEAEKWAREQVQIMAEIDMLLEDGSGVEIYELKKRVVFRFDTEATEEYFEECKENGEEPFYEDMLWISEEEI